jgi:hypothetical protein
MKTPLRVALVAWLMVLLIRAASGNFVFGAEVPARPPVAPPAAQAAGQGRPIFGVAVQGKKVAVYLDSATGAAAFLESVKQEIYKQFPDADIFEYGGAGVRVVDNRVVGGRWWKQAEKAPAAKGKASKAKASSTKSGQSGSKASGSKAKSSGYSSGYTATQITATQISFGPRGVQVTDFTKPTGTKAKSSNSKSSGSKSSASKSAGTTGGGGFTTGGGAHDTTSTARLSIHGRGVYEHEGRLFALGGAGAWVDFFSHDTFYDALLIVSNFQGGVRETGYLPKDEKQRWDAAWVAQFTKAKTRPGGAKVPRLYVFSVQHEPPVIWKRCATASGGEVKLVAKAGAAASGRSVKKRK